MCGSTVRKREVAYTPPVGWIERPSATDSEERAWVMFHQDRHCARIDPENAILLSDRPYSARRCPFCAKV